MRGWYCWWCVILPRLQNGSYDVPQSRYTVLSIYLGVTIAARWKDGKAWTAMLSYVPSIIGTILVATLPGTNKIGLLFSFWTAGTFSIPVQPTHKDLTYVISYQSGLFPHSSSSFRGLACRYLATRSASQSMP